jgi:hypothetical protein
MTSGGLTGGCWESGRYDAEQSYCGDCKYAIDFNFHGCGSFFIDLPCSEFLLLQGTLLGMHSWCQRAAQECVPALLAGSGGFGEGYAQKLNQKGQEKEVVAPAQFYLRG